MSGRANRGEEPWRGEAIKPSEPTNWRWLTVGTAVWLPWGWSGQDGADPRDWRAATVVNLGKNRAEHTVVHLHLANGGNVLRHAGELWSRDPKAHGKDKPPYRRR